MPSEESKVIDAENSSELIRAYTKIPYALINAEITGSATDTTNELDQICGLYQKYKKGADFVVEGTNGDYLPAKLRYKMSASLINKEARFLFAETPDIVIEPKGDNGKATEESKATITMLNDLVHTILDANKFEEALVKAAKDCFIGKRIAGLVNFNQDDGVTVTFLPSTQFIYETKTGNPNILTKFVGFMIVRDVISVADKRIFKKKYTLEDGIVWLEETMFDGTGVVVEEITPKQKVLLTSIPVSIFINDGLTGDVNGESEVELLYDHEMWYSKLANADLDAERKSMNPIRYTIDMDSNSTKNLSSSAGSYWDLLSDQNLEGNAPQVGMLESNMGYSAALNTSLERIRRSGFEQVDMPDIDAIQATITSGKALKAIYWPLIVRCKEKMKMWGPQLRSLVDIIIQGSIVYPNCITKYTEEKIKLDKYEIKILQNTPLPEDEAEEKAIDLQEVDAKTMSRKAYMQKWRSLTDDEVDEELEQIALEKSMLEDSAMPATDTSTGGVLDDGTEEDTSMEDDLNALEGELNA